MALFEPFGVDGKDHVVKLIRFKCWRFETRRLWSFGFPRSAASFGPSAEPKTLRGRWSNRKAMEGRYEYVTVWWGIWGYLLDVHHFASFCVKQKIHPNEPQASNSNVEDVQEMMQLFRHKGSVARLTIRCFSLSTAPPSGPLAGHVT